MSPRGVVKAFSSVISLYHFYIKPINQTTKTTKQLKGNITLLNVCDSFLSSNIFVGFHIYHHKQGRSQTKQMHRKH